MSRMADWIRKQMDKGYSPRQIKEELVSEGYSLSTINSAFEEIGIKAKSNNEEEEEGENGLDVDLPEEIPLMKVGGGVFLILVLIGIGGLMVRGTGSSLTPAESNFQSVESGAVENYGQFYRNNEQVLTEQDHIITAQMSMDAENSDVNRSIVETTTEIAEGGNRVFISTESSGGLVQNFREERFANNDRIWTKRVNVDFAIPNEFYSDREKSGGLGDINFAGQPFNYFIPGEFDEIERDGGQYVFRADSVRNNDPDIQSYSATLRLSSEGLIESGEATVTMEEDSMTVTREITYSAESEEVNVERPDWAR